MAPVAPGPQGDRAALGDYSALFDCGSGAGSVLLAAGGVPSGRSGADEAAGRRGLAAVADSLAEPLASASRFASRTTSAAMFAASPVTASMAVTSLVATVSAVTAGPPAGPSWSSDLPPAPR